MRTRLAASIFLLLSFGGVSAAAPDRVEQLVDRYLEAYFRMFPTRATAVGRHDLDEQLEDFSPQRLSKWIDLNREIRGAVLQSLDQKEISFDDHLDAQVLLSQIEHELNVLTSLHRAERDPLFWSSVIGDAVVFLLVRDDLPANERQRRAQARVGELSRFVQQARDNFSHVDARMVAPELCQTAAEQVRAAAIFYGNGFVSAVGGGNDAKKVASGAAAALNEFGSLLEQLGKRSTGSARLGSSYAATFRMGTGITDPVSTVLAAAEHDLTTTRLEAANFGRSIWREVMSGQSAPADDKQLLTQLFDRMAQDHDADVSQALRQWRVNVEAINRLVHEKRIITMPDPLTLLIDVSPAYFVGQSVGGVYPPGPYAPEAKTILFIPAPSEKAPPARREAFFRDFNQHFNKMIVAHELIPGHYVQFKIAAHQPHKIRSVFADGVYVEGWGTFCERVLLDQGWGGPVERVAHLKKQLENIARTIVDIRIHTENMSHDEVIRFVKEEALQGDQLAANMWTRSLTTPPQITTYYLGYQKFRQMYEATRQAEGDRFDLRRFMDRMMELGPVPLDQYASYRH